jgi:hypothetical protein
MSGVISNFMPSTGFLAFKEQTPDEWKEESTSYPVEMVEKH